MKTKKENRINSYNFQKSRINKIGIENIRQSKMKRLEKEHEKWMNEFQVNQKIIPGITQLLTIRIDVKYLILHIANDLKSLSSDVLLVENNDGFLFRDDVINYLAKEGVTIVHGSPLKQRVKFELRRNELLLVLLSDNYSNYLEDITQKAYRFEFFLDKYLGSYHIQSIINEDLDC